MHVIRTNLYMETNFAFLLVPQGPWFAPVLPGKFLPTDHGALLIITVDYEGWAMAKKAL